MARNELCNIHFTMPKPSSLLIVDDNTDFVTTCGDFLTESGFHVLKACSGTEAVDLCSGESASVGLAIVDLNMPDLDGPATIAALRKKAPRTKVMAMSGAMLVPYFVRLNELGVQHFLPKPFYLDELLASVQLAMNCNLRSKS